MLSKSTFQFLKNLKCNNRRDWFAAHKSEYQAARDDVVSLIDEWIEVIARFDPEILMNDPSQSLFRIYKDTRFSKDKTPYKTNFGAFLTDRGRKLNRAGYYLHIEPDKSFIAGGLYMPPPPELKAVRTALMEDAGSFRRLLKQKSFVNYFGTEISGERLKTSPRDIPRDHPEIDLLRYKSFEVVHKIPDRLLTSENFFNDAGKICRVLKKYIAYLNDAIDQHIEI